MKDKTNTDMTPEPEKGLITIDEEIMREKSSHTVNLEQVLRTLEMVIEMERLKED